MTKRKVSKREEKWLQILLDKKPHETHEMFVERRSLKRATYFVWLKKLSPAIEAHRAPKIPNKKRFQRVGYAAYYDTDTDSDRAEQRAELYASEIHEFVEDEVRGFAPHRRGRRDGLEFVRAMLKPGDELVITSINRLGYGPMQLTYWMATLQNAKVRILDVERLYGQEEPPAWWAMEYAANSCATLYEQLGLNWVKKVKPMAWSGAGWYVVKGYPHVWKWARNNIGAYVVELIDRDGFTCDQVSEQFNAKRIFYRSCVYTSMLKWTPGRVAEWYVAHKRGYPRPILLNNKGIKARQAAGVDGDSFLRQMEQMRKGIEPHEVTTGTIEVVERRMDEILGVNATPVLTPLEPPELIDDDSDPITPRERADIKKQRKIDAIKAELLEQFPELSTPASSPQ